MNITTREKVLRNSLLMSSMLVTALAGCANNSSVSSSNGLTGDIVIDGSSTVYPITEIVSEEFETDNPNVRIAIGISGSGGGLSKFCAGETDISNASRAIKPEEIEQCNQNGVEFIELPVAFDALSMVVNKENDWAACLTANELRTIWSPESQGVVNNWSQVREGFPNVPLNLYAPGTDSGTFDYFTEAINGEEGLSRGDITATEDDNVIVQGVSNDVGGLGYFGLSYLDENLDELKPVALDNENADDGGDGCIEPSVANVEAGIYQPLARPLFIYVKTTSLERPEVKAFVDFYLSEDNAVFIREAGQIELSSSVYEKAQARLREKTTGSVFVGVSTIGVKLDEVL
ncbi:PstS family phosphate ABC transporter substrate-binding protein [Cyanobacterium stanieri LEGE 03274]|uniref:Phosphate-binding protein n=1 Tax=Cyanobacterium stanieri LEGE 03274 TaxID=1828756 RepID=A0ABR9V3J2_9CHRO|nr:PstS family phosphate ABC transporter substrate-binding protein [Cyanobacterium stanieri]MBE9222465.1 PstS family phosphate ABC transporter substrate-binding protein [Cyanobacterium stanieri LEGE 03274]